MTTLSCVLHCGAYLSLVPNLKCQEKRKMDRMRLIKPKLLKPDLIILDLAMPVMNGLEAAPELRKMLPDARLILFTVHYGPQVQHLAQAAGIHAVVSKSQAASTLIEQAQA